MAKKCSRRKINGSPCKYPTARVYRTLANGNISKKEFDCVVRQIANVEKKAVADVAKADAKIEAIAEKAIEKASSAYAEPNKPGASNVIGLAAMGLRIKRRKSGRKSKKHSKRYSKKRSMKKRSMKRRSGKKSKKRKSSRKNKRRSH